MAGRGRGKSNVSFSMEQMLGISKGESSLSTPVSQPSVHYPPLEHKPPPLQLTDELNYLVEKQTAFIDWLRASPYYVKAPKVKNEDIERYSDAFDEEENDEFAYEKHYDWDFLPNELRASRKRKPRQQREDEQKTDVDIVKKLTELEEKENMQQSAEDEAEEEEDEEMNDEEKEIGDRIKEEEEDEMDDGTDYTLEYFENGENYYSEDENNDDQFYDG
ncbi:PREDICTED: DNA-directed RNA polymerase III subunit RPC7-like [Cyphomyrmex costatus]|uniref:DNA-directed RNA polymerase III subunit RPC7-like protein n=1 Tax=Cyphomyrmex costatus TaxID=456900 RepID=A0A151IED6_9HYME|nr:PREDICTED: DNA-directed RNA polymerase III subunit RPC7-like [Cyphomyrmex costatus]KYM99209.1 DNA-directed RNA polymerase III subunit RPC7-like protein [Cyphomyrmex costatus]